MEGVQYGRSSGRGSGSGGAFDSREPVRVLLVTAIRLYQDGVASALANRRGIEVCGAAGDVSEALDRIEELRPDVVLVDVTEERALGTVRGIAARFPEARLVALAVPDSEERVIECAEAGVAGFVTQEGSLDDVEAMIRSVARGETLCSPRIAARLLHRLASLASERRPGNGRTRLTSREREVADLIEDGLSNKEIAASLRIELSTVKNHVHNILEKLEVHRRGEAVARLRQLP